jgi:YD repeat-containing protein
VVRVERAHRVRVCARRKTDVKKLLTGIVALTITVGCAVAQAGELYDANGRLNGTGVGHSNSTSSVSGLDGRLLHRNVTHGNVTRTYDTNGRLVATGIRRGNVSYIYDGSNRTFRVYDTRGRLVGSGSP